MRWPGASCSRVRLDAVLSHEAFDKVEPADLADFSQVPEDATRTVNATTCTAGISDEIEQAGIFLGVVVHGFLKPDAKPCAGPPARIGTSR